VTVKIPAWKWLGMPEREAAGYRFAGRLLKVGRRRQRSGMGEAIRRSRGDADRRFRDVVEALPAAVYTTDASGRITYFNRAAVEFSGRTPKLGSDRWCVTLRLHWPDGRPMPHEESPMAKALKEDRSIRGAEAVAERPDGTRVPFMAYPTPLHDASGALVGAVNMLVDVTELKRAEQAMRDLSKSLEERVARQHTETTAQLHDGERQFRLLVQSVTDYAIFMLMPDGTISNWNPGAERIKGYKAEEVIGRHFSQFYTPEDRKDGLPARALATAAREGKYEGEGWRIRRDGTRFWALVVIDVIRDEDGALIGFAKITRDMTERRVLEEHRRQAQKMEAIGQLTSGVAHDFNNLLATIIPNLELAHDCMSDELGRKRIGNAMAAAERGAALTEQLLAFSRRQDLATRPVDLNRLVAQTSEMLPRTIGPAIAIETDLVDDTWHANTDPNQLQLALLNLAINARDAMPGGGRLTISTANLPDSTLDLGTYTVFGDFVRLSVSDTGTGMSEEVASRAFEPFFTTKTLGKGTGLGLSMVYGFVQQSGGAVTIDSEIGRGTTIEIRLPRAHLTAPANRESGMRGPHGGPSSRILLVDDDDAVREVTALLLKILGHDVVEATGGPVALDLLQRDRRFDLLLVDLAMPTMHGTVFAAEARQVLPAVPTLFMTGYADARWVSEIPADYILKKPFSQAALAKKLRRMLRRRPSSVSPAAATVASE
jgi:PAS domain S-box-containing protein